MNPEAADINMWRDEISQLRKKTKSYSDKENLIAFYGSSSVRLWENMD